MENFWRAARNFAQQALDSEPGLEAEIESRLKDDHDPPLDELLPILRDVHLTEKFNPYYQALREVYAVENDLFEHIEHADIVLILDKNDRLIFGQLAGAFQKLLRTTLESLMEDFDTYSTLHPVPFPDATRHGNHWQKWLKQHPEFDFRNPANDPRKAKSGPYHIGSGAVVGDPHGSKGTTSKQDSGARIEKYPHVIAQQKKLRYGALGACAELLKFLFQTLEPELCEEYLSVCREVAEEEKKKFGEAFETRRDGELFVMFALLINLFTTDHKDKSDWTFGFAGLVAVGDYEGGDMLLRELGLRIEARPGVVQLMRGRELLHSIAYWTGTRFCIVAVTPESVRRAAKKRIEAHNNEK